MWRLWSKIEGEWRQFAAFEELTGNYAEQVNEGVLRAQNSVDEEKRKAALIMQELISGKAYPRGEGKKVLRALRHFDEVGLSNDIHEALEEALDEGAEEFLLKK